MTSRLYFNAGRFKHHLKRLIRHDARVIAVSAGLMLLIIMLFPSLSWNSASVLILIAGMVYTSRSYQALNRPVSAMQFVMLPVSAFERTMSCWILSGVLFPALLLIVYLLAGPIVKHLFFRPDWATLGTWMLRYFVTHAIFLWGSALFRKASFLKSSLLLLTGLALLKLISLAAVLIMCLILDQSYTAVGTEEFWASSKCGLQILQAVRTVMFLLLIPLFVRLTHKRLKTVEV